jgi:hypothetical protein
MKVKFQDKKGPLGCGQEVCYLLIACHYSKVGAKVRTVAGIAVTVQIRELLETLTNKPG